MALDRVVGRLRVFWCLTVMMRFSVSGGKRLAQVFGPVALFWRVASGQESTVQWDPRETGQLELNFKTVTIGLVMALSCVGVWKLLVWLLERNRSINWSRARLLWPTAMLAWGWVMLAMFTRNESWGWWFEVVLVFFGVLNFPALMPAVVVLGFLNETFQLPAWLRIAIGSVLLWSGNYVVVRIAEWGAWSNVPVSLNLVRRK